MRLGDGRRFSGQAVDPNELVANRSRITTTTYWAGNQGQIYIGPYLIDEIVGFGYKINQSKIPIYGYNSQYFDAVADGKVLVSGWFSINYIDSGYLYAAIDKYVTDTISKDYDPNFSPNSTENYPLSNFPQSDIKKILEDLRINEQDPAKGNPWGTPNISLMKKVGQAINEDSATKKGLIQALRNRFWGNDQSFVSQDLRSNRSSQDIKANADQFNKRLSDDESLDYLSVSRPDQMPAISMTIAHGDPLDYNTSTFRVITGLHILSCEQNVHITDDPQTETYTFIARTINY